LLDAGGAQTGEAVPLVVALPGAELPVSRSGGGLPRVISPLCTAATTATLRRTTHLRVLAGGRSAIECSDC
jgi:hypothetical protein